MASGSISQLSTDDQLSFQQGTSGAYSVAEGDFSAAPLSGWFIQLGVSDDKVAAMTSHIGAGLTFSGLFNRQEDAAGLGVSHVTVSDELTEIYKAHETAMEAYYRYQVTGNIALKPVLQYLINPAADQSASDALIVTLRTELTF